MINPKPLFAAATFLVASLSASAFDVRVTIQNLAPQDPLGLYFGPVWLGFHNGSFDLYNPGTAASPQIELLAELGDSSAINTWFAATQPTGLSMVANNPGGPGPGLFSPGSSRSLTVNLDPMSQRYLSFGTMVVPSNDSFFANPNPLFAQLFDGMGNFAGTQSWTLTGASVWDAGTEVNDPMNGGVFVAGADPMAGDVEGGLIHLQPRNGLDNTIGITTGADTVIGRGLGTDAFMRISVTAVPEPSTYGLVGACALAGLALIRRKKSRVA